MELTEETLPAKYMCVVCVNPPGKVTFFQTPYVAQFSINTFGIICVYYCAKKAAYSYRSLFSFDVQVSLTGVRESMRYSYDQDWLKLGAMQSFSFVPQDGSSDRKVEVMQATHSLVADVLNVQSTLKSAELQLDALK